MLHLAELSTKGKNFLLVSTTSKLYPTTRNNKPYVSSYNLLGIYPLSGSSGWGVKTRCIIRSGINTSSVARLCPINHWPSTFRQSKLQPSRVIDKPDLRYYGANSAILRHRSRTSRRVLSGKLRAEIGVFVFRR